MMSLKEYQQQIDIILHCPGQFLITRCHLISIFKGNGGPAIVFAFLANIIRMKNKHPEDKRRLIKDYLWFRCPFKVIESKIKMKVDRARAALNSLKEIGVVETENRKGFVQWVRINTAKLEEIANQEFQSELNDEDMTVMREEDRLLCDDLDEEEDGNTAVGDSHSCKKAAMGISHGCSAGTQEQLWEDPTAYIVNNLNKNTENTITVRVNADAAQEGEKMAKKVKKTSIESNPKNAPKTTTGKKVISRLSEQESTPTPKKEQSSRLPEEISRPQSKKKKPAKRQEHADRLLFRSEKLEDPTTLFIKNCVSQLHSGLLRAGKIFKSISSKGWDKFFRLLLNEVSQEEIQLILDWYITPENLRRPYTPAAYAARTFYEKFLQIKEARERVIKESWIYLDYTDETSYWKKEYIQLENGEKMLKPPKRIKGWKRLWIDPVTGKAKVDPQTGKKMFHPEDKKLYPAPF